MKKAITYFLYCTLLLNPKTTILHAQIWQPTNGPYGGSIWCLGMDTLNHLFAGTSLRGGVYHSTNYGATWTELNEGLSEKDIRAFAIDRENRVFVGIQGGGVLQLANDRTKWIQTSVMNHSVQDLILNSKDHIFVATTSVGIFRSTDHGTTWVRVNNGLTDQYFSAIAIDTSDHVYVASTNGNVFRSTDNCDSWSKLGGSPSFGWPFSIVVNPKGHIFVGTGEGEGILRSTDEGKTWLPVNNGLWTTLQIYHLGIDPDGNLLAGVHGSGAYISTDNGDNWQPLNSGMQTSVYFIHVGPKGRMFSGTYQGVFMSLDSGKNWSPCNIGLRNTNVSGVVITKTGALIAGTTRGVFRSHDNGLTWTEANSGLFSRTIHALKYESDGSLFAATYGGGLFRSIDDAENWTFNGLLGLATWRFHRDEHGRMFVSTLRDGVFRSTDGGATWIQANEGLTNLLAFAFASNSAGYVFLGSDNGLFRSLDGGEHWVPIDSGLLSKQIRTLVVDSKGRLLAGTTFKGVFLSTNNGDSWFQSSTGLSDNTVSCLAHAENGYIFAGTFDKGVFRSTDDGATWHSYSSGLTNNWTQSLAVSSSGMLFVGTTGGGVFRALSINTSVEPSSETSPPVFSLSQNYPNPFNPTTAFMLTVGSRGRALVEVVDLRGRVVATLIDQTLAPGVYEIRFDGSALPTGVYFARLRSDSFVYTKKILLLK